MFLVGSVGEWIDSPGCCSIVYENFCWYIVLDSILTLLAAAVFYVKILLTENRGLPRDTFWSTSISLESCYLAGLQYVTFY